MTAANRAIELAMLEKRNELMGSVLPSEERQRQIQAAGVAVLVQQSLARQASIDKLTLEADATERLTGATGGGAAAMLEAERATMLAAEAASGGTVRIGALAAAWDRVQAAKNDQRDTQLLQGLTQEYQAAGLLADAQGKGAAAMAAARIETEHAKLIAQGYSKETAAAAVAVMALTEAERNRGELAGMDRDYSRQLTDLDTELRLVGATVGQREYELALLELRHKLEAAGVDDVEKELEARREIVGAMALKRAELDHANKAAEEMRRVYQSASEIPAEVTNSPDFIEMVHEEIQ